MWNYVGEKRPMNFAWNARLPRSIQGSFTCRKSTTWDRRLYFPSEGRRAEDFFVLKNPTASARFEPANLGTKGQHATSRPPKPLFQSVTFQLIIIQANYIFHSPQSPCIHHHRVTVYIITVQKHLVSRSFKFLTFNLWNVKDNDCLMAI